MYAVLLTSWTSSGFFLEIICANEGQANQSQRQKIPSKGRKKITKASVCTIQQTILDAGQQVSTLPPLNNEGLVWQMTNGWENETSPTFKNKPGKKAGRRGEEGGSVLSLQSGECAVTPAHFQDR